MEISYIVDFKNVSTIGLESSPVVEALAGLRANEAHYFMNKYKREFAAKPLETSRFQVENIKFAYVFYEDGLEVNVMYTVDDPKKRL
ncbi:hypothetical protein HMPREF0083_04508 [Aneurinibacillus aneurinilyticus ATCC 12856]|uniref:Uncharacterized protein n=1 Tax=Aneurinibacillus aneurinilyticus ATCC 12856 TaxID=649747 RepID=U1WYS6_ANEAE|nr:hypothetical protein HMPREF0083_04508 [Aneurinibacillus aneurinilyticus ATCC 12856]